MHQFTLLEKAEQVDLIEQKAIYVTERVEGNYTYKLYHLEAFYIEEEWHTTFNERRTYIAFISEERLQPYLNIIDLSALQIFPKKN
jgi:hypothetical protein